MSDGETYLCRCECISIEQVDVAIAEGNLTINDIKRRTRVGMGICQGIFCLGQWRSGWSLPAWSLNRSSR